MNDINPPAGTVAVDANDFARKAATFIVSRLNNDASQIELQAKDPKMPVEMMHNGMDLARSLRITAKYMSGDYDHVPNNPITQSNNPITHSSVVSK